MPTSTPTDPYTRDPAVLFSRRVTADIRVFNGARDRLCEALDAIGGFPGASADIRNATPGDDLDEHLLLARRQLRARRDAANASADIQAPTPYTSALRLCGDLFASAPGAPK